MSINVPTYYTQQYSNNITMLLQIEGGKFTDCVMRGSHTGKQASPVEQVGAIEMQEVTSRFSPMGRVDAPTDRRWVFPRSFDLPQMIDSYDKLKMIIDPTSAFVQSAAIAANRRFDRLIIEAFTGSAKTGETAGTTVAFTSGNEVDVAVGGANSKLNVAKIKAVRELMETNYIDFDREEAYIGITAADHASLLNEMQVISSDFNSGAPVLKEGKVVEFLGFKLIQTQLIEEMLAGTNEVTLPVWVKSGMHLGVWSDIQSEIDRRIDVQGIPYQIYTKLTAGATRLEENKVYAIESYRA